MENSIRPRRLFVSGGSRLTRNAALLWRELGKLLAMEDGLVVITGGFSHVGDEPSTHADWMIVEGMLLVLQERGVPAEKHIETFLPAANFDRGGATRFKEGRVVA